MKIGAPAIIVSMAILVHLSSVQSRGASATTLPCPSETGGPISAISVYLLPQGPPGFQPHLPYSSTPPSYASPAPPSSFSIPLSGRTSSSPLVADLAEAFIIAPPFFVQQLCHLDGIFINTNHCTTFLNNQGGPVCAGASTQQITEDSWGYREGPWQFAPGSPPPPGTPAAHYGRYIALSAGPWNQANQHAPSYSNYAQTLLQQLLPWADTSPPSYSTNTAADTSAMAVLASLAHEFGHVLWYDTFRPTPGGSYDFNTFCRGTFFRNTWRSVDPPPMWREFGEIQNEHAPPDIDISDIALAIARHSIRPGHAGDLLHEILKRGAHWASPFAAFSPDEDFIETYTLYVLTKANPALTSLKNTITGATDGTCSKQPGGICQDDVPSDLTGNYKPELRRKLDCIANLVNPNP